MLAPEAKRLISGNSWHAMVLSEQDTDGAFLSGIQDRVQRGM